MDAPARCTHCTAPLTDHGYLCHPCTARLASDLRAIPDLLAELDTTITRQARITTPNGKGNGDKPIPFDTRASDAALQVRTVTYGWSRVLNEEIPPPTGPEDDENLPDDERDARTFLRNTRAAAHAADQALLARAPTCWLTTHLPDARMREWAGELADELRRASDHGWSCIDRPEERYYAGHCGNEVPIDDGFVECGTVLWVKLADATVRCRGCLHVWDTVARRDWLLSAAQDHLESARIIASALTVMTRRRLTASTIRSWASDGIIEPWGERDGAKLYRVGDVLAAMNRPAVPRKPGDSAAAAELSVSGHAA